jgi:exonuclease SbcC
VQTKASVELAAQADAARAILGQNRDLWSPEHGLVRNIDKIRSNTAAQVATLEHEISILEQSVTDQRASVGELRRVLAQTTSNRDEARERHSSLVRSQQEFLTQWLAVGLTGAPDRAQLDKERNRSQRALARLENIDERRERIVVGYRSWLHDDELTRAQGLVTEQMSAAGVDSEEDMRLNLKQAESAAYRRYEATERTREKVERIVVRLQAEADQFADQVLHPLNATIQRFSRALMTRADGSIYYKAEHLASRSELRPGIVRIDASGEESLLEMNPNLFFSEGQLSALSVSALMAASTTFQWSRWRSLLMDDPLQHNDVIHASAFIDLLKSLVTQLKYQVVISTHDAAEATFMARKFESAGIPFKLCELYPHGNEGLVSEAA